MANREMSEEMSHYDERQIIEQLDRDVDRKGTLFGLLACLAIVGGLALSVVLALSAV